MRGTLGNSGPAEPSLNSSVAFLAMCETSDVLPLETSFVVARASRPGFAWLPVSDFSLRLTDGEPGYTASRSGD
jgi:hypothetical protein